MKSSILPRSSPLRLTTLSPISVLAESVFRLASVLMVDMKPPETKKPKFGAREKLEVPREPLPRGEHPEGHSSHFRPYRPVPCESTLRRKVPGMKTFQSASFVHRIDRRHRSAPARA